MELSEEEKVNVIDCVGMDGKNHYKVSWSDKTLCGHKVYKNGEVKNQRGWRYGCWECDGILFKNGLG